MSVDNVQIAQRGWDAFTKGDLERLFEIFDPAVVWETTHFEGWPEETIYRGHDGVRHFMEDWLGSWERYEAGTDEFIDVGDDRVLVLCWQRGYGPGSEVPVHMEWGQLCTIRDGLVCHLDNYSSREAALEAVGLAEGRTR